MRKFLGILFTLLVVGGALFFYFRFYFVFGEGVKSGELNYVVYKGENSFSRASARRRQARFNLTSLSSRSRTRRWPRS